MQRKHWFGAFLISCGLSFSAFASSPSDVKASIVGARDSLLQMLKDPTKRGVEQQKLVTSTADKVTKNIQELVVAPEKKAKHDEMIKIWNEFNEVRTKEVVPFILSGKTAEAEKLANGIQKERLMKIMKLCDELK